MKKEDLNLTLDDFRLPDHETVTDGTGMYPLKERIRWKSYLLTLLLPAAFIHLLLFGTAYMVFRSRDLGRGAMISVCSIPPLLISSLFLLQARREDFKDLKLKYFSAYERGRRFVIGLVISLAASGGFLYFTVYHWQLFSLPIAHLLLAAALLFGNMVLIFLSYELASYIMFGILTWLVSVVSFSIFDGILKASPLRDFEYAWLIAQTLSFVLCVMFAFITNRLFVFTKKGNFWMDMLRFFGSRIVSTLIFEVGAMYVLINLMHVDNVISKFVGAFLVTIANYFLSKFFVFRGGTAEREKLEERLDERDTE